MLDIDSGVNKLADDISALAPSPISISPTMDGSRGILTRIFWRSARISARCAWSASTWRELSLRLSPFLSWPPLPLRMRHLHASLLHFISLASSDLTESVDLSSTDNSVEHIRRLMAKRQAILLTQTLIGCHRLTVPSLFSEILSPLIDSSLHPSSSLLFRFSRPLPMTYF